MNKHETGDLLVDFCTKYLQTKMHLQLVSAICCQVISHIDREVEVTSTIETGILSVDVNPSFVVNSSEVQVRALAGPVGRNIEGSREPGVTHPATLNTCSFVSH